MKYQFVYHKKKSQITVIRINFAKQKKIKNIMSLYVFKNNFKLS